MTITARKLFGSIGTPAQAAAPAPETAQPGYGAWYAQQMARSYETRRSTGTVVRMFREALYRPLPLAA